MASYKDEVRRLRSDYKEKVKSGMSDKKAFASTFGRSASRLNQMKKAVRKPRAISGKKKNMAQEYLDEVVGLPGWGGSGYAVTRGTLARLLQGEMGAGYSAREKEWTKGYARPMQGNYKLLNYAQAKSFWQAGEGSKQIPIRSAEGIKADRDVVSTRLRRDTGSTDTKINSDDSKEVVARKKKLKQLNDEVRALASRKSGLKKEESKMPPEKMSPEKALMLIESEDRTLRQALEASQSRIYRAAKKKGLSDAEASDKAYGANTKPTRTQAKIIARRKVLTQEHKRAREAKYRRDGIKVTDARTGKITDYSKASTNAESLTRFNQMLSGTKNRVYKILMREGKSGQEAHAIAYSSNNSFKGWPEREAKEAALVLKVIKKLEAEGGSSNTKKIPGGPVKVQGGPLGSKRRPLMKSRHTIKPPRLLPEIKAEAAKLKPKYTELKGKKDLKPTEQLTLLHIEKRLVALQAEMKSRDKISRYLAANPKQVYMPRKDKVDKGLGRRAKPVRSNPFEG